MAEMVQEALGHMDRMENNYKEAHPNAMVLPGNTNEPVTASDSESERDDTDQFAPRNDPSRLSVNEKVFNLLFNVKPSNVHHIHVV